MAELLEILLSALAGAVIALIVHEVFAWKFTELERRRSYVENLLTNVYGPIYVITEQLEAPSGHYGIYVADYRRLQELLILYQYEFDREYLELFLRFLKRVKGHLGDLTRSHKPYGILGEIREQDEIGNFITKTNKRYTKLVGRHSKLHKMRAGVRNNLTFIFLRWRF